MRKRDERSDLLRFLVDREEIRATTKSQLTKDLNKVLDGIRALAGGEPLVNGALRQILLQPLRQLVEDLEAIEKMGRREEGERLSASRLGLLGRWLTTPRQSFGTKPAPDRAGQPRNRLPRRLASWVSLTGGAKEELYELPRPIAGRRFVIWNEQRSEPQFRAWSRNFHEPVKTTPEPAPSHVVEHLEALTAPPRVSRTAPLRLCLAYGQHRISHPWIYVGRGTRFDWMTDADRRELLQRRAEPKLTRVVPQSLLAATIPILGPNFGIRVERLNDSHLCLTWSGALLIREVVHTKVWLPKSGRDHG